MGDDEPRLPRRGRHDRIFLKPSTAEPAVRRKKPKHADQSYRYCRECGHTKGRCICQSEGDD